MTSNDLPLASATPGAVPHRARVSARARARVATTDRSGKMRAAAARIVSVPAGDARRWWLVAARPVSLRAWLRAQRPDPARVPEGSPVLRRVWALDNWTLGLAVRALSVVLYLAAGALAWAGGHPLRRWSALLVAGVFTAWVLYLH